MSFGEFEQIKAPHTDNDWLQALEEYAVHFAVLSQSQDDKLVEILRHRPGWATDFEGDGAVIFARSAQKGKRQ